MNKFNDYRVQKFVMKSGAFINYNYLIVDDTSKNAAIIDPAWDLEAIEKELSTQKARLTHILLTHSHHDHTNLVNQLVEKYDCDVYIHHEESRYYKFISHNMINFKHLDIIYLGNTKITCYHTPGHTTGSSCFMFADCIFTGDTLFNEGCGICTPEGGDPYQMYHSLNILKNNIQPNMRIFPGHCFGSKPGMSYKDVLKINIYLQINQIDTFVSYRMRQTKTTPSFS